MKHQKIEAATDYDGGFLILLQQQLAGLAAGLDGRFVRAATMLEMAIETIDRVVVSLDGILNQLDAQTAGAVVLTLRESAERLAALPGLQEERVSDIGTVRRATSQLQDHVMQVREVLHVLRVNGNNLRIAAAGSREFETFVDDMFKRFDSGDAYVDEFNASLRELATGIAAVQRVARLLADESAKVIPQVPSRLTDDALELQAHQAVIAETATRVGAIARSVQARVSVVIGSLQIGDIARQRIEHLVAAIQILDSNEGQYVPATAMHLLAMQLDDIADALACETGVLLDALTALGPDTSELLSLIDAVQGGEDQNYVQRLERGIVDIEAITRQLRIVNERTQGMNVVIVDRLAVLTRRLEGVRQVRADVQHIAVNALMHGLRRGAEGRAITGVAEEIGVCVDRLSHTFHGVAWAIRELESVSLAIRHRAEYEAQLDAGLQFGKSLSLIREGCRSTGQGIDEGSIDARDLIDMLDDAGIQLRRELGFAQPIRDFAQQLRLIAGMASPSAAAETTNDAILERIFALYTMARERDVHRAFLCPDRVAHMPAENSALVLDDGLF